MKYLILILVFFFGYYYYKKRQNKRKIRGKEREAVVEMVRDEKCGIHLPKGEALKVEWQGKMYYFCSQRCKEDFFNQLRQGPRS